MNRHNHFRRLAAAIRFLTRLPAPPGASLPDAAGWFGLVGALVGAIMAAVWLLAGTVLPAPVSAGLAVAAGLLVTGALHEDGLADSADALGGSADRERILEILRDSRIGTYGAAALVVAIGLRWAMLASLPAWEGAAALLLSQALGRSAMVAVAAHARAVRSDGLGQSFQGAGMRRAALASLAVPLLLSLWTGWVGLFAIAAGLAAAFLLLAVARRRIGGTTGDILGAAGVLAELATLAVITGGLS